MTGQNTKINNSCAILLARHFELWSSSALMKFVRDWKVQIMHNSWTEVQILNFAKWRENLNYLKFAAVSDGNIRGATMDVWVVCWNHRCCIWRGGLNQPNNGGAQTVQVLQAHNGSLGALFVFMNERVSEREMLILISSAADVVKKSWIRPLPRSVRSTTAKKATHTMCFFFFLYLASRGIFPANSECEWMESCWNEVVYSPWCIYESGTQSNRASIEK